MKSLEKIEKSGLNYDKIIFEDDFLPGRIYKYQIEKRNSKISKLADKSFVALDVGCGTGFHTYALAKKCDQVISSDVSINAVRNAQKKILTLLGKNNVEFVVCDGSKLPFREESIDLTWISGVLHHIPEHIPECIEYISKITRKQILLDEPNKVVLWRIIMKLSKADPVGNERPLSIYEVKKELEKNGYEVINSTYWGFLVQIAILLRLNFLVRSLEKLENRLEHFMGKKFFLKWTINAKKRI